MSLTYSPIVGQQGIDPVMSLVCNWDSNGLILVVVLFVRRWGKECQWQSNHWLRQQIVMLSQQATLSSLQKAFCHTLQFPDEDADTANSLPEWCPLGRYQLKIWTPTARLWRSSWRFYHSKIDSESQQVIRILCNPDELGERFWSFVRYAELVRSPLWTEDQKIYVWWHGSSRRIMMRIWLTSKQALLRSSLCSSHLAVRIW